MFFKDSQGPFFYQFAIANIVTLYFLGVIQVAKFCAERIHEVVAKEWETLNSGEGWQRRWEAAFCNGFEKVDDEVITESVAPDIVGSTAVVVVVSGCQIIASNCGDSRAILCRRNQTIQLTKDHKVPLSNLASLIISLIC